MKPRLLSTQVEEIYPRLGAKLAQARKQRDLTQEQLGAMLDPPLTRASIANIENGKQRLLVHTLLQLGRAMKVEVAVLLAETEAGAPPSSFEAELEKRTGLNPAKVRHLAEILRGKVTAK